jgi:hypothetical protein
MPLNGQQLQKLNEALIDAFNVNGLQQMLLFRLGLRLDEYSLGPDLRAVVFDLMTKIQREGDRPLFRLVDAARRERPENDKLADFAQELRRPSAATNAGCTRQPFACPYSLLLQAPRRATGAWVSRARKPALLMRAALPLARTPTMDSCARTLVTSWSLPPFLA